MIISDEIKQFYAENNTPIEKMITVGMSRLGLTSASIRQAAITVYEEIQSGADIKSIRIAWRVFAVAKLLKAVAEQKENDHIQTLKSEIEALRKELEWHKQSWWKRLKTRRPLNA